VQNTRTWIREAISQSYNNLLRNITKVCFPLPILSTTTKTLNALPNQPANKTIMADRRKTQRSGILAPSTTPLIGQKVTNNFSSFKIALQPPGGSGLQIS
jgi:hypothetical protein